MCCFHGRYHGRYAHFYPGPGLAQSGVTGMVPVSGNGSALVNPQFIWSESAALQPSLIAGQSQGDFLGV